MEVKGKKLSFIVPVYNAEKYLGQCLDSLLRQGLSGEEYEILCVDDGSTDGSPAILDGYAERFPHVRVIHKENGGVTTARNVGLREATGDYIWFVDADDLVREKVLEAILPVLFQSGCDRLVVDAYTFTDELTQGEQAKADTLPRNTPWQDAVVWRNVLSRQFLLDKNLSFAYPELTHGEDGLFMYEVGAGMPETVETGIMAYFYRVHSDSAETTVTLASHRKKLKSFLRLTQIMNGYYRSGRRDAGTANKLMSYLWFTLYEAAHLPRAEAGQALAELKELGLYPGAPLPECSLTSAYLMGGSGVVGKALDSLCMRLQAPWAYQTLRLLVKLKG